MKTNHTPMIKQYLEVKENYQDAILFWRLGDFYEMFFDDAVVASKVLEIALTSRDKVNNIAMCGVPYHAAKVYIQKLVEKGFKVAIAEQVTEAGKGLVQREVTRVVTPGMIVDDGIIAGATNNYLASIAFNEQGYVMSYCDITTGESFVVDTLSLSEVISQITSLNIKEIILENKSDKVLLDFLRDQAILTTINPHSLEDHKLINNLNKFQKVAALRLLSYLNETQKTALSHFQKFIVVLKENYMKVDFRADRHLEITQSVYNQHPNTLLYHLDNCQSSIGSRKLKQIISNPIINIEELNQRYDMIDLFKNHEQLAAIIKQLAYVYDISRIVGRINYNNINAKDLSFLRSTLHIIPELKSLIKNDNPLSEKLIDCLDEHQALNELLTNAIVESPPLTIKEGGMIKEGFNAQLDELIDIAVNGDTWLEKYEAAEKERSGIKNLRVRYNRIFGYFIDIPNSSLHLVTDDLDYIRKQTLSSSERYVTTVLNEKEQLLLNAKDRANALEYNIFNEIKTQVAQHIVSLQELSNHLALIDVYTNLAMISVKYRYTRPKLTTARFVDIVNGRHPVVEKAVNFVANHIDMRPNELFLITGPNMSGKSTYMRMFALIVYMAQIGCFVPADQAVLPIYDAIFTRIGSSDDLAGGKSTFMVEMLEANIALSNATDKSLILFDEIGRGTATYDGLALAQGMVEYIHEHIKAQTLFSTHYHELVILESKFANIANLYVEAKEQKDEMVFLHQVKKGSSSRSYGIQVAALANLPAPIINRSKYILKKLENKTTTVDLFSQLPAEEEVSHNYQDLVDALKGIDVDHLTPVDALMRIKYLQDLLKKKG